ncbi:carboxypeptidase regulatory-like domain-containing protein [Saccharicrinis sp. FJH54]|uniref:TonB-dependent receptor n=1 Tax=Saccharicrinis sp. FJH54 TaxID=3344665 RepID=UPI0035D52A52
MKYIYLFSIFLVLWFPVILAQPLHQTIRGRIIDEVTGYPLPGATVTLTGSDPLIGVTTNTEGYFEIEHVSPGRQSVDVSFVGYETTKVSNILVTSAKEIYLEIELREKIKVINELTVRAKKQRESALNPMAAVSARSISIEETERFAGSLGDPARMVANFAGVVGQNDMRNDIVIRGNSPMGLLWRLEGMEIPNPNHFAAMGTTGGPVSILNNNLLTQSDFMTGAFPAEFGNALSGVFDLNMRSGNNKKREYVGQVGFNGFELGAEGPLGRSQRGQNASYMANYRYSTLDVVNKLGFDLGAGMTIPQYKDLTFVIDFPGNKAGRFKLIGLWGNSLIELGRGTDGGITTGYVSRNTATDFGTELGFVGLTHQYYFNENIRIRSTLSVQYAISKTSYDSVYTNPERIIPYYRSTQNESKLSLTTEYKHKINSRNNYSLGIIRDHFIINYADSVHYPEFERFVRILDIKGNNNLWRGYVQWQHKFSSKLTLNCGLYSQYYDLNEQWIQEPRLSMVWQISQSQTLSAGYGKHSQIQAKSIYYHQFYDSSTDSSYTTNENLKMSRSNHYVLSYNLLITHILRFKTELYYQYLYDIPGKIYQNSAYDRQFAMINAGDYFTVPAENFLSNNVTGENYGIEFTMERFLDRGFYFLWTTSLYESKYKPLDGIWRNTAFNGNFVCNLLLGYEIQMNEKAMLTFDSKTVYAGGRRYVPYNQEASASTHSAVLDWEHAWEKRFGNYFRTDLRIGFKYNREKMTMEWGLDLQNLTNYRNVFQIQYDVNRNEEYAVYQQGFFPMMLYRVQF